MNEPRVWGERTGDFMVDSGDNWGLQSASQRLLSLVRSNTRQRVD